MHNSSQGMFLELYCKIQIPLMTLADHVLCSLSIGPHQEGNSTSPLCAGITKQNCNNFNNLGWSAAVLPLVKHFAHFLWDMRKGNYGFFFIFLIYIFLDNKTHHNIPDHLQKYLWSVHIKWQGQNYPHDVESLKIRKVLVPLHPHGRVLWVWSLKSFYTPVELFALFFTASFQLSCHQMFGV